MTGPYIAKNASHLYASGNVHRLQCIVNLESRSCIPVLHVAQFTRLFISNPPVDRLEDK
jgi:hypothetical protein